MADTDKANLTQGQLKTLMNRIKNAGGGGITEINVAVEDLANVDSTVGSYPVNYTIDLAAEVAVPVSTSDKYLSLMDIIPYETADEGFYKVNISRQGVSPATRTELKIGLAHGRALGYSNFYGNVVKINPYDSTSQDVGGLGTYFSSTETETITLYVLFGRTSHRNGVQANRGDYIYRVYPATCDDGGSPTFGGIGQFEGYIFRYHKTGATHNPNDGRCYGFAPIATTRLAEKNAVKSSEVTSITNRLNTIEPKVNEVYARTPDYNENNVGSGNYIQNRPFYEVQASTGIDESSSYASWYSNISVMSGTYSGYSQYSVSYEGYDPSSDLPNLWTLIQSLNNNDVVTFTFTYEVDGVEKTSTHEYTFSKTEDEWSTNYLFKGLPQDSAYWQSAFIQFSGYGGGSICWVEQTTEDARKTLALKSIAFSKGEYQLVQLDNKFVKIDNNTIKINANGELYVDVNALGN